MASSNPGTGIALEHLPNLTPSQDSMNGKIIISALAILLIMVLFMVTLHIYAKWFWRRADRRHMASWRLSHAVYFTQEPPPRTRSLDKDVVESLPIFIYKSSTSSNLGSDSANCSASATVSASESASASSTELGTDSGLTECGLSAAVECAVCLCEFQDGEKCRLLPKCNHSFHSQCIDMWFMSNTTCPLCRTSADPSVSEDDHDSVDVAAIMCLLPPMPTPAQHHNGLGYVNGVQLDEAGTHDDAGLRRQFSRSWTRSISERFSNIDAIQFPTNVLFWGNHGQVNSRLSATEQWHVGGRSFPHVVVDVQERPEEGRLIPSSTSGAPFCSSFDLQSGSSSSSLQHTTTSRLSSLKRILGRDKRLPQSEQAGGSGTP